MQNEQSIDGYHQLAAAISVQAVTDFRKALKHLAKGKGNLELDIREIKDVIRFVNSKWFKTLTNVQPEIVIQKLKEEVYQSGIRNVLGQRRTDEFIASTFQDIEKDRIH